jgi:hypothetical protein
LQRFALGRWIQLGKTIFRQHFTLLKFLVGARIQQNAICNFFSKDMMFIDKLFHAFLSFDMNIWGLAVGVLGGILVTWFGMPSLDVLNSGAYTMIEETPKIRRYKRWSRIGLILILFGFVLQLAAAVNAIKLS